MVSRGKNKIKCKNKKAKKGTWEDANDFCLGWLSFARGYQIEITLM